MIRGLYQAATGMKVRLATQETVANNLANAGTAGFQREVASVHSRMIRPPLMAAAVRDLGTQAQPEVEFLSAVSTTDTQQGALQHTGSNADIALDGPGYLVALTNAGPRLLRGGAFHPNANGNLATLSGDPILGADGKPIPVGDHQWQVAPDGTVTAGDVRVGRLKIVLPLEPARREGSAFLSAAGVRAVRAGTVQVRQGFLERANVEPVREMVDMIAGMRAYEASQRAVLSQDETLQKLLEIVRQ
jgi:flagellar basal body rod protein FlgG